MKKDALNVHQVWQKATLLLHKARPYSFVLFILFVGGIYGFVSFRISTLTNVQPTPDSVAGQVQAAQVPRIDPQLVQQLKSLQDNSVSVQALFDAARSNPFQQ